MARRSMHGWLAVLVGMIALVITWARPVTGSPPAADARVVDLGKLELVDVATGRRDTLKALAGAKATVVFFSSNECPVALAYEQDLAGIRIPARQ
jgi:hypothetical protein